MWNRPRSRALGCTRYCTDGFQTLWNQLLSQSIACIHRTFNCIDLRAMDAPQPAGADVKGRRASARGECVIGNATTPHVLHFAGADSKPWNALGPTAGAGPPWGPLTDGLREGRGAFEAWRAMATQAAAAAAPPRPAHPAST